MLNSLAGSVHSSFCWNRSSTSLYTKLVCTFICCIHHLNNEYFDVLIRRTKKLLISKPKPSYVPEPHELCVRWNHKVLIIDQFCYTHYLSKNYFGTDDINTNFVCFHFKHVAMFMIGICLSQIIDKFYHVSQRRNPKSTHLKIECRFE